MNDQVSRESFDFVKDKSIKLAIVVSKPTLKMFMKGLKFAVGKPAKAAGHAIGQKIHPTEGKQSVKTLIRQGQGVSTIPLADEGLKDFQKIAKKYGVDFAVVKDKSQEPPVYTIFFKAKDQDAVTQILNDYAAKQIKKSSVKKTSVLEKLKKFKEIVAAIPKKVVEKKKERSL